MEKQAIFEAINKFEQDHGEAFLDQGFNLNERTFMSWCLGRGYLNPNQFNLWIENMETLEGSDANYYVYNSQNQYEDVPWAIVSSEDWNREDQDKAFMILAEFISEIDIYIERLKKYIEGED